MKRIFALTVLALFLMGARSFADDYGTKPEAAKTPAMSAKKGDAALLGKLEILERKVWDAFKNQDFKGMKEVIASDATSVDINGFTAFDQIEPMLKDYMVNSYTLQDWKITQIDKDAAVVTYSATLNGKYKGEPIPAGPYYASTVYAMQGGKWRALFHQETLAASAMAMPGAASSTGQ